MCGGRWAHTPPLFGWSGVPRPQSRIKRTQVANGRRAVLAGRDPKCWSVSSTEAGVLMVTSGARGPVPGTLPGQPCVCFWNLPLALHQGHVSEEAWNPGGSAHPSSPPEGGSHVGPALELVPRRRPRARGPVSRLHPTQQGRQPSLLKAGKSRTGLF